MLRPHVETTDLEKIGTIGTNPAHNHQIEAISVMSRKRNLRFSRILKFVTRNRNFGINMPRNLFPHQKIKKSLDKDLDNNNKRFSSKSRKPRASITVNTIDMIQPQYAWTE